VVHLEGDHPHAILFIDHAVAVEFGHVRRDHGQRELLVRVAEPHAAVRKVSNRFPIHVAQARGANLAGSRDRPRAEAQRAPTIGPGLFILYRSE